MARAFRYVLGPKSCGVLVQFVDVPEAHSFGATEAAAGEGPLDCLIAVLCGYVKLGRRISRPTPACG